MELRQLEYFVAVAEQRSFTGAARRERVAQPAVSAQIRRLERRVGQPLFTRSNREVRLTRAGAAMLPHARAALAAVRDAARAVDDVADLVRGAVAIGTVTLHPVDVVRLVADFHRDYPAVEITLGADTSDMLLDAVVAGRLDLAIASVGGDAQLPHLETHVITDEAVQAAVAPDHPLARRRALPLDVLCEYPLISLPAGAGLRSRLDTACAAAGLTARVVFEATSPLDLAELAEHGLGVAILPESTIRSRPGLRALPLQPALRGRLVWAWRRDATNPAARLLRDRAVSADHQRPPGVRTPRAGAAIPPSRR